MISTVETMLENSSHGNHDFTKNGNCSGCGSCCSNLLPLSKEEIQNIKYYIKRNSINEQVHILNVFSNKPVLDMTCPFMKNSGTERCTIYEARPEICRIYKCDAEIFNGDFHKITEFMKDRSNCNVRETFFGK